MKAAMSGSQTILPARTWLICGSMKALPITQKHCTLSARAVCRQVMNTITATRKGIRNDEPIIAPYGVNKQGSGDMYPKSGNMLHSIRHAMNDDEKFRAMLRYLNKKFYHKTVTTEDIQKVVSEYFGSSVEKIFDQYLRTTQIPVLEYFVSADKTKLSYRYTNCVDGFNLPIAIATDKGSLFLGPESNKWNTKEIRGGDLSAYKLDTIEKNYYVTVKQVAGN
jgi:hypothetical protein